MKESEELRLARAAYLEKIAKHSAIPMPATAHYTAGYKDGSAILWAVANECADVERKAIEMADQIAELKAENEQIFALKEMNAEYVKELITERDELKRQRDEYKADAERYKRLIERTERGCYQLRYWDTDRDSWYEVSVKGATE